MSNEFSHCIHEQLGDEWKKGKEEGADESQLITCVVRVAGDLWLDGDPHDTNNMMVAGSHGQTRVKDILGDDGDLQGKTPAVSGTRV